MADAADATPSDPPSSLGRISVSSLSAAAAAAPPLPPHDHFSPTLGIATPSPIRRARARGAAEMSGAEAAARVLRPTATAPAWFWAGVVAAPPPRVPAQPPPPVWATAAAQWTGQAAEVRPPLVGNARQRRLARRAAERAAAVKGGETAEA